MDFWDRDVPDVPVPVILHVGEDDSSVETKSEELDEGYQRGEPQDNRKGHTVATTMV